jgi:predicted DCC family thiol-disulfide oxidoreductase YuxK
MIMSDDNPLMLFDGVCNLCSASMRFVLKYDRTHAIRFATMQSTTGQAMLHRLGLPTGEYESFLFIEKGQVHAQSRAALRLARSLAFPWRQMVWAASILPRPLADWLYRLIARNRYRLFGKRDTCLVPQPHEKARFLD